MSRQVDGIIAVPCGDDPSLFECISSGERSTTQIELSPTLITGASVGTPE
ncbi:MAG: hypothetical protein MR502_04950 [Bacteroides sp.]|nr:hypothetical protein [Bacteroides sp.]MCI7662731.1 hypothetical protein [Bacteroides sp.]